MSESDYGFPPVFPERFNMADYYLDARIREGKGDRVAVKVGDRSWTYREVQEMADRCGHALRDRGIDAEDRVLILLYDGVEFAATFFGLLKAGATFCMGNPLLNESDFDYLLGYTRARAVVADEKTLAALEPALEKHPRCKVRFVVGEDVPDGFERFDDALKGAAAHTDNAETYADDVAGWLFTSGTTGKPKGAVHLHRHFPFNTECYAKRVLELNEDDVFVSVSRLFFGYATGTNLMFPFAVGGTAVLFPDKPTPERIFEHVEEHGVTVLTNVPAMIRKMVDHEDADRRPMTSLRMCLSAGEALPPSLYERWQERWAHCEILDGIGSAEMFHIYITNYPGDVKPGSLGRLVPGYEARVAGPDGGEVDDGEMGRLWIRGESAAIGYWRDQKKSQDVFRGEWTVSADLFRKEGEYFFYAGRGDDMLKVRGMFVSPLEIEDCLGAHPAVREAAVVGVDDGSGLTVPKAWVVLRDGLEPSDALIVELQQHAKASLARYKFPHQVAFIDALPRNDRGKVVRRALEPRDA